MQTDIIKEEPAVNSGSIMQSPLSVTDCERPPITLIVSAQSLKEQYQKDIKRQQQKKQAVLSGGKRNNNRSDYHTPTRAFSPTP